MFDIMGVPSNCSDDAEYLKNLPDLAPGYYAINYGVWDMLQSKDSGHVISYIKEADGSGYILDPNGFQLKCKNPEEAIELIQKVIILYSAPRFEAEQKDPFVRGIFYRPESSFHNIQISKIELLQDTGEEFFDADDQSDDDGSVNGGDVYEDAQDSGWKYE